MVNRPFDFDSTPQEEPRHKYTRKQRKTRQQKRNEMREADEKREANIARVEADKIVREVKKLDQRELVKPTLPPRDLIRDPAHWDFERNGPI